jgi:hypothetical protein
LIPWKTYGLIIWTDYINSVGFRAQRSCTSPHGDLLSNTLYTREMKETNGDYGI